MGDVLGLGITHYPLLAAPDERMADLLRVTLRDPDIPESAKDVANWPPLGQQEWGTDGGTAAAAAHRAKLLEGLAHCRKELDAFAAAMASADGKVLLHCTVAWRASHLWAAYLIRDRQVPVTAALEYARKINLGDDRRVGDQQPLEGFLGRAVPEIAHPK